MSVGANKIRIGRSFHRQAGEYDQHAIVQKRIVDHLDALIATHVVNAPSRLLDIGCGTGAMLATLHERYPQTALFGLDLAFNMSQRAEARLRDAATIVNGDAERLPFREQTFGLVVSTSTLQWVQRLDVSFRECRRVLSGGGLMCAAFFGGQTLWELQESYREALTFYPDSFAGRSNRLHRFSELTEVRQMLSELGFDQLVVTSEIEMEHHADVTDLLRAIKGIGAATSVGSNAGVGLGSRGVLNRMSDIYRSRYKRQGMIPATYEVIYIIARCR